MHPGLRKPLRRLGRPAARANSWLVTGWLATGWLATGCTGPTLQLDNPGHHPVFVDGKRETSHDLPFRYYGTTTVDALPADLSGTGPGELPPRADWSQLPVRQQIAVPAPASPWLFPLDFPLEVATWLWRGQPGAQTTVTLEPAPAAGAPDVRPVGFAPLVDRATAARTQR